MSDVKQLTSLIANEPWGKSLFSELKSKQNDKLAINPDNKTAAALVRIIDSGNYTDPINPEKPNSHKMIHYALGLLIGRNDIFDANHSMGAINDQLLDFFSKNPACDRELAKKEVTSIVDNNKKDPDASDPKPRGSHGTKGKVLDFSTFTNSFIIEMPVDPFLQYKQKEEDLEKAKQALADAKKEYLTCMNSGDFSKIAPAAEKANEAQNAYTTLENEIKGMKKPAPDADQKLQWETMKGNAERTKKLLLATISDIDKYISSCDTVLNEIAKQSKK